MSRYRYGDGFTYFVRGIGGGPIKVGQTGGEPARRLRELQSGSPVPLRMLVVLLGSTHERTFHERFAADRLHGEWFTPTRELRKAMVDTARGQRGTFEMRLFTHPDFWIEVERCEQQLREADPDYSVDVLWPQAKQRLWEIAAETEAADDYPLAVDLLGRAA